MKNKILFFLFFLSFLSSKLLAENIFIEAKNISLDKNNQISLFENEVKVITEDGYKINSDLAEYNKSTGVLILRKNITGIDKENNTIKTDFAKYNEKTKILVTNGPTKIISSEKYIIESFDITLNNFEKRIFSEKKTIVTDQDKNQIIIYKYLIFILISLILKLKIIFSNQLEIYKL